MQGSPGVTRAAIINLFLFIRVENIINALGSLTAPIGFVATLQTFELGLLNMDLDISLCPDRPVVADRLVPQQLWEVGNLGCAPRSGRDLLHPGLHPPRVLPCAVSSSPAGAQTTHGFLRLHPR
jgi:hypothetical protein